jgi:glyoxalase family protein
MQLNGLHHITAVTANANQNVNFYTDTLGLRLVKKTVNQDDVSAYHLFYADRLGTPGTDITFFDWAQIGPNVPGADRIAGTVFRVDSAEALDFWEDRLTSSPARQIHRADFGEQKMISFQDPEGQQLYLVNDQGAPFEGETWDRPDIPEGYLLKGFYSVILSTPEPVQIHEILVSALSFELKDRSTWIDGTTPVRRYLTHPGGGPGAEVWVLEETDRSPGRLGAGGVHHAAFRVKDQETQEAWRAKLRKSGIHATQVIDRYWFKSIYFRISRGILFEIATEGPGFTVDESLDSLGESLVLPPFLESRREDIEAELTPIKA